MQGQKSQISNLQFFHCQPYYKLHVDINLASLIVFHDRASPRYARLEGSLSWDPPAICVVVSLYL